MSDLSMVGDTVSFADEVLVAVGFVIVFVVFVVVSIPWAGMVVYYAFVREHERMLDMAEAMPVNRLLRDWSHG